MVISIHAVQKHGGSNQVWIEKHFKIIEYPYRKDGGEGTSLKPNKTKNVLWCFLRNENIIHLEHPHISFKTSTKTEAGLRETTVSPLKSSLWPNAVAHSWSPSAQEVEVGGTFKSSLGHIAIPDQSELPRETLSRKQKQNNCSVRPRPSRDS